MEPCPLLPLGQEYFNEIRFGPQTRSLDKESTSFRVDSEPGVSKGISAPPLLFLDCGAGCDQDEYRLNAPGLLFSLRNEPICLNAPGLLPSACRPILLGSLLKISYQKWAHLS